MRSDDIFEALTDIDDKFIAAAHPREFSDDPAVFRPEPRRPLWKTLVPVAACAAIFAAAGVFGVKYFTTRPDVENSNYGTTSGSLTSETSETSDNVGTGYQVITSGLAEIKITTTDVQNTFTMEEFPGYEFGAFNTGITLNGYEMNAIDVTLIDGNVANLYLCDLNGDGKRELCATVYRNGEKCVEVLDFANSVTYSTYILSYEQRYLEISDRELVMVSPFHDDEGDIYVKFTLSLDNMAQLIPGTDPIELPDVERFGMVEFPELCFIKEGDTILMGSSTSDTVKKRILEGDKFYLADINGDGMRELCTYGSSGNGIERSYISVYDIANDKTYRKSASIGSNIYKIWLELKDGELYIMQNEDRNNAGYTNNYKHDLRMGLLNEVTKPEYEEIPLVIDQTFTLPDFEGFTFTVHTRTEYPSFDFSWEGNSKGVANSVDEVFLYDLDGDGRREMILNCPYAGLGSIWVYGIMDNGEVGQAFYFTEGGCRMIGVDGELICETGKGEWAPLEFTHSDLKLNFTNGYKYEFAARWDHDHILDFSEILPWIEPYEISVGRNELKIIRDHKTIFLSETVDVYSIHDAENGALYFVYTVGEEQRAEAVKITENAVYHYSYGEGCTVLPTSERLLIVDIGGNTEPFVFYQDSDPVYIAEG